MQGAAVGENRSAVALAPGIDPVVVNVAVECFIPTAVTGNAELVMVPGIFIEIDNDQYIAAFAGYPAVKRQNSVEITP